jgi:ABC-2 type transport system ATP-binding protein
MTSPAIAVEKLVKIYKRGVAVDGITFNLPAGSVTGLLGGNGAGKTTTIAMRGRCRRPMSSRVCAR